MLAEAALIKFTQVCKQHSMLRVLDIGAGQQDHTIPMKKQGLAVETNDFESTSRAENLKPDHPGNYLELDFAVPFEGIWSSHTLEHQRNPGMFLDKVFADLKEGGVLGITVPPRKDEIVGGHVTMWNAGLLLYHLVLAGFDCSNASVASYGYNCSVVVRKKSFELPDLCYCRHDIASLSPFFPKQLKMVQGKTGIIDRINW